MKEKSVVKGLVLRSTDTKESDQMLTVLTAPMGKLSVVAKGARSRHSRVAAAAQLLAYSEMVLTESHGWQILTEASTIELFDPLRRDVVLLSLGSYFAELTDAVTFTGMEAGELLSHLLNALYALGNLQKDPTLVKAAFEWKLMALAGFEPLVDGCAVCGCPQPEEPMINVVQGIVHCRSCNTGGGTLHAFDSGRAPGHGAYSAGRSQAAVRLSTGSGGPAPFEQRRRGLCGRPDGAGVSNPGFLQELGRLSAERRRKLIQMVI